MADEAESVPNGAGVIETRCWLDLVPRLQLAALRQIGAGYQRSADKAHVS